MSTIAPSRVKPENEQRKYLTVVSTRYIVIDEIDAQIEAQLAEAHKQRTERILIVNDEEIILDIFSSMLTAAGYECRAVAGGLEALALLASGEEFDLLLTDMLNSPMDGLSLLQRVKGKFPEISVVVTSAIDDRAVVEECFRSGACDYVFFPLDREKLLVAVSGALTHRR
jgi:DNA-binding NtrC family response regulator